MSDQIDISRKAVDGVAAFWWGKRYPKIADLLWSLRSALDAADVTISDLTAQLSDAHKLIDDNWVMHQRVAAAEAEKVWFAEILQAIIENGDGWASQRAKTALAAIRTGAKP